MLQVANIFQDHMILQRDKKIYIWGEAEKEECIEITIQGKTFESVANEKGDWIVELQSLTASESEVMVIKGKDQAITIKDVAVGEVWLAAGQSNMEFSMKYEKHFQEEYQNATNCNLRFYDLAEVCYEGQEQQFDYSSVNVWRKATKEDLEYFSAVGYFFQKELQKTLSVPVGIIGCNWGGTRACAWMNEETVNRVGSGWIDLYKKETKEFDMDEYWRLQRENPMNDRGNLNEDPFCNLFMPKTPSIEEFDEYNKNIPEDIKKYGNLTPPQMKPGCLYQHMIKKIAPYGIKGVLWYQGEGDDVPGLQDLYETMLTALIEDWRIIWKDEKLPFFIVQLPGWRTWLDIENHDYATIRCCQEQTAKNVSNVFLCSISDAGEEFDIHPKNKKVVGYRLALLSLGHVYDKDILCDAPVLEKIERKDKEIVLTFQNAGEELKIDGDKLEAMNVVEDENKLPFQYNIQGNQLFIYLDKVPEKSVNVEFAQEKWYKVNLYNSVGIPAIPFFVKC